MSLGEKTGQDLFEMTVAELLQSMMEDGATLITFGGCLQDGSDSFELILGRTHRVTVPLMEAVAPVREMTVARSGVDVEVGTISCADALKERKAMLRAEQS